MNWKEIKKSLEKALDEGYRLEAFLDKVVKQTTETARSYSLLQETKKMLLEQLLFIRMGIEYCLLLCRKISWT